MELNRNHYLTIGLVVLALGIQFRRVESFVLNKEATAFIAKRIKTQQTVTTTFVPSLVTDPPPAKRVVKPPKWLGWAMVSGAAVMILYSLVLPKPG